ncbi:MAG: winged helix-turn-helix domain-containing protein [Candidatus Micrarchaeia archaeon]
MDSQTRLLYWLLLATRGGPTRVRILRTLYDAPANMRQLSLGLSLDYKTVQGHIELMLENGILDSEGKKYGAIYVIAPEWGNNIYLKNILEGTENGKKRK